MRSIRLWQLGKPTQQYSKAKRRNVNLEEQKRTRALPSLQTPRLSTAPKVLYSVWESGDLFEVHPQMNELSLETVRIVTARATLLPPGPTHRTFLAEKSPYTFENYVGSPPKRRSRNFASVPSLARMQNRRLSGHYSDPGALSWLPRKQKITT